MRTCKLAILFSGNGSNMQNLVESLHNQVFIQRDQTLIRVEVVITLCNNPLAYGITRAKHLNIPCEILSHTDFNSREDFDQAMLASLRKHEVDLCVLAGFMRILTPSFTRHIKAINIHPSYLPEHKGMHAITQSFLSGKGYGGVSVHWVNEELDGGDIILQERLIIDAQETLESFESRIHALEHTLYPQAILKVIGVKPSHMESL